MKKNILISIAMGVGLLTAVPLFAQDALLAFPGAEGFGRLATGGARVSTTEDLVKRGAPKAVPIIEGRMTATKTMTTMITTKTTLWQKIR